MDNNLLGGSSIWIYVLALVLGIIIVIAPAVAAYLIALFLIVYGVIGIVGFLKKK